METGAIVKTAFCGPCFGAGRHTGQQCLLHPPHHQKLPQPGGFQDSERGRSLSVALMDARSIAATAANKGYLTPATEYAGTYSRPVYHFDSQIYANRVFDSHGIADPLGGDPFRTPISKTGPKMPALAEHLLLESSFRDP